LTQSDETKISQDRREALRYPLAIGRGAALTSAIITTPA
jgi:polar amino acid transport system substrate-binding protein